LKPVGIVGTPHGTLGAVPDEPDPARADETAIRARRPTVERTLALAVSGRNLRGLNMLLLVELLKT